MLWPSYDVFFSYSRSDSEQVTPLYDELRRMGYRVFFDIEAIDPASPWRKILRQAIRRSRTLVLCWSEHSAGSEYVSFEYNQAEALHRRILPWRLDKTELPPMLEGQAISNADPAEVAKRIRPVLGWTLGQRRRAWSAAIVAVALGLGTWEWHILHPPPWEFRGEVTDINTRMPISDVEVDAMSGTDIQTFVLTDARGGFDLRLPQPKPEKIDLRFRKDGYHPDQFPVSTDAIQPFPASLTKAP